MLRTLGHRFDGRAILATDDEIIENALFQEREGIEPHYALYDHKTQKPITARGWLVWSLSDGCGIVYRREDGKLIICCGQQGDFCYC